MKKQFFRVKQLADQTFSRAGKTEVLSDELQEAERRVEYIRSICQNAGKKLANPGAGTEAKEKRLKKNPDYLLGMSMLETVGGDEYCLLKQVVTGCAKLQMCLASSFVDHEIRVESNVVAPLINIIESDFPNIMKLKRNLSKLILDMDSARARYQAALKHSSSTTAAKADSIKDEFEEAEAKVEQCRDLLACEMLQLLTKETELSTTILEYAKLQKTYHAAATAFLDEFIPEMESAISESSGKAVFGTSLEEHLRVTNRKIAYPIELCVCALLELGMGEEGLFRVAAGAGKVRRMKLSIDANMMDLERALQHRDPHIFASILKSYLRELPEPLLTHKLYDQWMNAARVMSSGNTKEGLTALWSVLRALPPANQDNLHYLIKFFSSLASNKQSNKMTPQNLAIVIAPNLMWSPNEDTSSIGMNMNTANIHSIIVDTFICYADWFFPGDIDFYVTFSREMSVLNGHIGDTSQVDSGGPAIEIKRSQSNSSLSDQHSPPQGSPKPAVRIRKHHKAAAPNPPVNKAKPEPGTIIKSDDKDKSDKPSNPEEVSKQEAKEDKSKAIVAKEGKEVKESTETKEVKETPKEEVKEPEESKPASKEPDVKSSSKLEMYSIGFESLCEREPKRETQSSREDNPISAGGGALDRRTSKSGEDLRKIKPQEVYSTLERRRSPSNRPVPAPRTSIVDTSLSSLDDAKKPSIPQRPPNLPRPLSSSFRISRNFEPTDSIELSNDNRSVSLERTHVYSVDKQQVAIIQVPQDKSTLEKKESIDKPEKPKKPDSLGSIGAGPPVQLGHQRAASEGCILDTSFKEGDGQRTLGRPPRPTPPPPPTPGKKENVEQL